METVDGGFSYGGAGSDDHAGEAGAKKKRGAAADAAGVGLPGFVEPGGKIVEGHDARAEGKVGDGEIGAVENVDVAAGHFLLQTPEPPLAGDGVAGAFAEVEVAREI